MAVSSTQLQQLYLAYFGRPADFAGIAYYTGGDWDIWQVARAFSASPESQALYGPTFNDSVIQAIYHNLFNRDAEPDGLLYWSHQVTSGALTAGEVALAILLGAQNADAVTVAFKLAAASEFTAHVDTEQEIAAYAGETPSGIARDFLESVAGDNTSLAAALSRIDAIIASIVGPVLPPSPPPPPPPAPPGPPPPPAIDPHILTVNQDTFVAAAAPAADAVTGFIDDNGTTRLNTFSTGDTITGNGHTTLDVTLKNVAGAMPTVQMSDIAELNFINQAGTGTASFTDTSGWADVSKVTLGGQDGMELVLKSENSASITLAIDAGTQGAIEFGGNTVGPAPVGGVLTTARLINATTDATGPSVSLGTAGIDVLLGAGDTLQYASRSLSLQALGGEGSAILSDLSIGHVDIAAGVGAKFAVTAFLGATATDASALASVDGLTVGQVNIAAGANANGGLVIYNSADALDGFASTGDVTIASQDITVDLGGVVAESVYNVGIVKAGSGTVYVGGLTLDQVEVSGSGRFAFQASNSAAAVSGTASVGDIAVGAVSLDGVDSKLQFTHKALTDSVTGGAATTGTVTIGSITVTGDGPTTIAVEHSAMGDAASSAGDVKIGNVDATVGNSFTLSVNGESTGTLGTVTFNDIALTLAGDDADTGSGPSAEVFVTTDGGSPGNGNIVVGDITVGTSGVSTAAQMATGMEALIELTANDGTVTTGDITVGAGGFMGAFSTVDNLGEFRNWFQASGTSVTIGTVDFSAYSGDANIDVHGYNGAATIKGGMGANTVVDNDGTNVIDLSASTAHADTIYLQNSQAAVGDTGTAHVGGGVVTADLSMIDTIVGWSAGDRLTLFDGTNSASDDIDGDTTTILTGSATYADFLVDAEAQITANGASAAFAVIGGDTFVALNSNGNVGEVVKIAGTHRHFRWDAGALEDSTLALTVAQDAVSATDPTSTDVVDGFIDDDGTFSLNTFSEGDTITGNGHTILDVTLRNVAGAMPTVQMSDIAELNFINQAGTGTASFTDTSGWTDVSKVTLGGQDGMELLFKVTNSDAVTLAIDADTSGAIQLGGAGNGGTAQIGGANTCARLVNATADAVAASASLGDAGIDVVLGAGDSLAYASRSLAQNLVAGQGSSNVGDLAIGNVNIDAGPSSTFQVDALLYATSTDPSALAVAGDLTLGQVIIDADLDASGLLYVSNEAVGRDGSATVGNLTIASQDITAGPGAVVAELIYNWGFVTTGPGTTSVGKLDLGALSASGSGQFAIEARNAAVAISGIATVGDVSVGAVSLGGVDSSIQLFNKAETDGVAGATATVGTITIDSITVTGDGPTTIAVVQSAMGDAASSAGDVKIGNVDATVGDSCALSVNGESTGTLGTVTFNDIALTLAGDDADTGSGPSADVSVTTDGGSAGNGNIVVGDITVGTSGVSTAAQMATGMEALIELTANDGTVTTGNITVGAGGFMGTALGSSVDNLGDFLNWFQASGTSVTIGTVDYSAYSGDTNIDVHGFSGAATIKGGMGANSVVDNDGTNTIDLSASTAHADTIYLQNSQAAVSDTGTPHVGGGVITADLSKIDTIVGWSAGDRMTLFSGTNELPDKIDGNGTLYSMGGWVDPTGAATLAILLSSAEVNITNTNQSAIYFCAYSDSSLTAGDTYIVLNNDGKAAEVVKITGLHFNFAWDDGSLVFVD